MTRNVTVLVCASVLMVCGFGLPALGGDEAPLVRTIDTSEFSPPSPDPAGITYLSSAGTLLMSDSEVNETDLFDGKNLFEMTLDGDLLGTDDTLAFTSEPTGVAYDPGMNASGGFGTLFFSDDDDEKWIHVVDLGFDGVYGTDDDEVTSFTTEDFSPSSSDPEGVAFDTWEGALFVVDGLRERVYRILPGPNGVFDGVPPEGDDEETSFDTGDSPINIAPEGIAFNTDTGTLYIVGEPDDVVAEITTGGDLVRKIDISDADPDSPAGLAYGPGSEGPNTRSLYITDRGEDNNSDSDENDGLVYEFALPPPGGCIDDDDCDDSFFCNGEEVCADGDCEPGEDPCPGQDCDEEDRECVECFDDEDCSDSIFCNGLEVCDDGECESGADPCPGEECLEPSRSCAECIEDADCADETFCNGTEICSAGDCEIGADPCDGNDCDEGARECIACNHDGNCDQGESCESCPEDCPGALTGCGNGVCEPALGENCLNCGADCKGVQDGPTWRQFCCGDGGGRNPMGCDRPRCGIRGFTCSETPVGGSCCGDDVCEGAESPLTCPADCGEPECGEDLACCDLAAAGESCTKSSDCCSQRCRGRPGHKTCR